MAHFRKPRRAGRVAITILLSLLFAFPFTRPIKSQDDDDDVVRVTTDLVVLNVTVVDSEGKFINGLRRGDFKLFVDGREQKISSFMPEETPFAAAVLLDTSSSMENRLMFVRSAAIRFLQELREDDVAAVYRFDDKIELVQDYSSSRDLGEFAFSFRATGATSLNDAVLRASIDLRERSENRRAIVILSDGEDTRSRASAGKAVDTALLSNATIYAVDMSAADRPLRKYAGAAAVLKNFAEKTGGRYVSTAGGQVMRDAFQNIADELSKQYTVAYSPPTSARDGRWHTLEVKVSRKDAVVRTRKGYHAPK
jgi:Ca-activated chloride channel family protein